MGRPSKTRRLDVWMNGEPVGQWTLAASGRHEFRYATRWLSSPAVRPLSLSMPLRPAEIPYRDSRVEAFFDNLLPDSHDIRRRLQARFGTASTNAFDLLAEVGRDCVGAIQLWPEGIEPQHLQCIEGTALDEAGVAAALRSAVASPAFGQRDTEDFRLSLAGAQEKTALLRHNGHWHRPHGATPTTHIFKLPLGRVGNMQADLSASIENEWLCAQIMQAYGLKTAHCEMAQFEDQRALIVERFDRKLSSDRAWWLRLPQEDLCQALGVAPGRKYEADGGPGIRDIMALLLGAREARADRRTFFKTQILFWMLAAPDGHAKNFSVFIEPGGRYSLTPLYDLLSTYPILGTGANQSSPQKLRLAMAVHGTSRHYHWARRLKRHWLMTASVCDFASEVETVLAELVAQTPNVIASVASRLPRGFSAAVSVPILKGLEKASTQLRDAAGG